MANLKRTVTPEWLEKRTNNLILPRIMAYYNTSKLWSHRCTVSNWIRRRSNPRPRRDFRVTRLRQDRDFEKRVSRRLEVSTSEIYD